MTILQYFDKVMLNRKKEVLLVDFQFLSMDKLDLQSKLTFKPHIELGAVSIGLGTEDLSHFHFISALSCISEIL